MTNSTKNFFKYGYKTFKTTSEDWSGIEVKTDFNNTITFDGNGEQVTNVETKMKELEKRGLDEMKASSDYVAYGYDHKPVKAAVATKKAQKPKSKPPKPEIETPFIEALLKDESLSSNVNVYRTNSVFMTLKDKALNRRIMSALPNTFLIQYSTNGPLQSITIRKLLIIMDTLNYITNKMEACILLKQFRRYSRQETIVVLKCKGPTAIKKLTKIEKKCFIKRTKEDLLEIAYIAGFRNVINTNELNDIDDPCVVVYQ